MKGRKPKPKDPTKTAKGTFAPDRDIFERQPWDTDETWAGFVMFRDMSPAERGVKRVSELVAKQRGIEWSDRIYQTVLDWSAQAAWRSRVDMWDLYVDRERRKQILKRAVDMRDRHAKYGVGLQQLGGMGLKTLLDKAERQGRKIILSVPDIKALIDLGIRIERESHDEPGTIIEERHQLTSDDKRESMRDLLRDNDARAAARLLVKKLKCDD